MSERLTKRDIERLLSGALKVVARSDQPHRTVRMDRDGSIIIEAPAIRPQEADDADAQYERAKETAAMVARVVAAVRKENP